MAHNHSYKATIKKLSGSKIEIESEIPAKEFDAAVAEVLADAVKNAELPGFRKGTAPAKIIREKLGETLLRNAAREAIAHAYGHIIDAEKIDAIGSPDITITKVAEGNPLGFKLVTAVLPEIKDFDYKTIAEKENKKESAKIEVTDKEFSDGIETIKKEYARATKSEPVVELTDELVQKFGDFSSVADFEKKLRDNMYAEKEQKEKEKRRLALIDALVAGVTIEIPDVLTEHEQNRMVGEMQNDIARMGLSWADYLKHLKKTEADMKKEWEAPAKKRATLDLAIDYIAKQEKIVADETKVKAEVHHVLEHHKDIDPERARSYFEQVYRTQSVFEFLETQK